MAPVSRAGRGAGREQAGSVQQAEEQAVVSKAGRGAGRGCRLGRLEGRE